MEKILKTSSGTEIKVVPKEANQGSPVSISSDGKLVQYRTDATQIEVLRGAKEVWISVFGEREAAYLLNQFIIEGDE